VCVREIPILYIYIYIYNRERETYIVERENILEREREISRR
jgi:hypothetical protein